jgi:hypothetical protein
LHSASVFTAESGQPLDSPFDRNFISKELNILEDNTSNKLPLLYSILFGLKKEVYEPMPNNTSIMNQQGRTNNMPENSTNKFKDQNININVNPNVGNSVNRDKNYFNSKNDQPQPWIID